jgi:hypothetical protein
MSKYCTAMVLGMADAGGGGRQLMDQMGFDLNLPINEGYRSGKPVIVLSNEGKVLHGRKELEACVRSGTSVSTAVIRGIKAEEWAMSDWPETMEAARRVYYDPANTLSKATGACPDGCSARAPGRWVWCTSDLH